MKKKWYVPRYIAGVLLLCLVLQCLLELRVVAAIEITSSAGVSIGRPYYDFATQETYTTITVTNTSSETFTAPVFLTIDAISASEVSVSNMDGINTDGLPFFVLVPSESGGLFPGGSTTTQVRFNNPSSLRFDFTPHITQVGSTPPSNTNNIPVITSIPPQDGLENTLYTYDVVATDSDQGDKLTYTLISAPTTMTIGSDTGKLGWLPLVEDIGGHQVVVQVSDGIASVTQSFELSIKAAPDRQEPIINLRAPIQVEAGTALGISAIVTDDTGVAKVVFLVDGFAVGNFSSPPYAISYNAPSQPGTQMQVVIQAIDPAGNTATISQTIQVVASADIIPPEITSIIIPPTAAPGETVTIKVEANDDGGIREIRFYNNGNLFGTAGQRPFESLLTIPLDTVVDSTMAIDVVAEDNAGNTGDKRAVLTLVGESDTTPPSQVDLTAPSQGMAGNTIQLAATAIDDTGILKVTFFSDGIALADDSSPPYTLAYKIPLSRPVGSAIVLTARAWDYSGNSSDSLPITVLVQSQGRGFISGQVFNQESGQPLGGARVQLIVENSKITDLSGETISDNEGRYNLQALSGKAEIAINAPGYTRVWRHLMVEPDLVNKPLDARLLPLSSPIEINNFTGANIAIGESGGVVRVEPGSLADITNLTLVSIDGESLPEPLPLGWKPILSFSLEPFGKILNKDIDFILPSTILPPTAIAAVFNPVTRHWQRIALSDSDSQGDRHITYDRLTTIAIVQGDTQPPAPPLPEIGAEFQGVEAGLIAQDAVMQILPGPDVLFMQTEARSAVSASLSSSVIPPSGTVVQMDISEWYDRKDGYTLSPRPMTQDIILYQTNEGASGTITVSPSVSVDPMLLDEGRIHLEAHRRQGDDGTAVIGQGGGSLINPDGLEFVVPPGLLNAPTPIRMHATNRELAIIRDDSRFMLWKSLSFDLGGAVMGSGAHLFCQLPTAPVGKLLLVAPFTMGKSTRYRVLSIATVNNGKADFSAGSMGLPFSGLTESGEYFIVEDKEPTGFVTGTMNTATGVTSTGVIEADTMPFVDIINQEHSAYVLLLPLADSVVSGRDIQNGDSGEAVATINGENQIFQVDLALNQVRPVVVGVTPADSSVGVKLNATIQLVFSRRLDPTSLTTASLYLKSDSAIVTCDLIIQPDGKTVVVTPNALLDENTNYQLVATNAIIDIYGQSLLGNGLDQSFYSSFTTEYNTPPPLPLPGNIVALPPVNGYSTVSGTAGSLEPGAVVTVTDQTTGVSASVMVGNDGSFTLSVDADINSKLELTVSGRNGVPNSESLTLKLAGDGASVLNESGGEVRLSTGEVLSFPPGVFNKNTLVRMTHVSTPDQLPANFEAIGEYVKIDTGGTLIPQAVKMRVYSPEIHSFDYTTTRWPLTLDKNIRVPDNISVPGIITIVAELLRDDGATIKATQLIEVVADSSGSSSSETVVSENAPWIQFTTPSEVAAGETNKISVAAIPPDLTLSVPIPSSFETNGSLFLIESNVENGKTYTNILDDASITVDADGNKYVTNHYGMGNFFADAVGIGISAGGFGFTPPSTDAGGIYNLVLGVLSLPGLSVYTMGVDIITGPGLELARSLVRYGTRVNRGCRVFARRGEPFTLNVIDTHTNNIIQQISHQAMNPASGVLPVVQIQLGNDNVPPMLDSVTPDPISPLPVISTFAFKFLEDLDPATVNSDTVFLVDASNRTIDTHIQYNPLSKSIEIIPVKPLAFSSSYQIHLLHEYTDLIYQQNHPGISDLHGNTIQSTIVTKFYTETPAVNKSYLVSSNVNSALKSAPLDMETVNNRIYTIDKEGISSFKTDTFTPVDRINWTPSHTGRLTLLQDISFVGADGRLLSGNYLLAVKGGLQEFDNARLIDINDIDHMTIVDSVLITYPLSVIQDIIRHRTVLGYPIPPSARGVPKVTGIPSDVETIADGNGGAVGYVSTIGVGIQSINLENLVGNSTAAARSTVFGPAYPLPNYYINSILGPPMDFSGNKQTIYDMVPWYGKLLSVGLGGFVAHDANSLSPLQVLLTDKVIYRISIKDNYLYDIDGDGNTGSYEDTDGDRTTAMDELYDLAFLSAGSDGLYIADLSANHINTPKIISHFAIPNVSFFESTPIFNGKVLLAVDKRKGLVFLDATVPDGPQLLDNDNNGVDDRVIGRFDHSANISEISYSASSRSITFIADNGLFSAGLTGGCPSDCDNGNPCDGWEFCDAATAQCVHNTGNIYGPISVDDGDANTLDYCDPGTGTVSHFPITGGGIP